MKETLGSSSKVLLSKVTSVHDVSVHRTNTEPFWKSQERIVVKQDSQSGCGTISTALKRNGTAFS